MSSPSELQSYIEHLQQQLLATQQKIQQLKIDTENEFKQYSLSNSNNTKVLKPTKPPTFDGDRRVNAEVWLLELENYFAVTSIIDSNQRVSFAVSQLRDNAVLWWRHVLNDKEQNTEEIISNWSTFKKTLLANYRPVEASETARVALHRLKQSGTVAAYCDSFLKHLNNIDDMNLQDQIFLFKSGLTPYIAKEVHQQRPKTLADAMSYAQRAELELRIYRPAEQVRRGPPGSFRPAANRYPSHGQGSYNKFGSSGGPGNAGPVPMELGNINFGMSGAATSYDGNGEMVDNNAYGNESEHNAYGTTENGNKELNAIQFGSNPNAYSRSSYPPRAPPNNNYRVPGLTREQLEAHKRNNTCFSCGSSGHWKNTCPKK